jgi:YebC/PmpR family DNA-binding regulatory protein
MGRIFEKRKERMFARWAKNAKAFTKLGKELAIAVKHGGPAPENNPRLRMAIQTARALNMPKDRIEAAIKRASGKDQASLAEVVYEGYGPYGVAILVETATDNTTRTVANVRSTFSRYNGTLGTSGSLDFVFQRRGVFRIAKPSLDLEELELELIDHGLEDMFEAEDGFLVYCEMNSFGDMQKTLEAKKIEVLSASPQRFPLNTKELSGEQENEINKLVEALEEDDDVQHVYHNIQARE